MGCDIHTIVEVKRNGKWEYIPELPEAFDCRSYGVFSILNRDVRNYNDVNGFEPKGLPADISGKQYRFCSQRKELEQAYARSTFVCYIEFPNPKTINAYDEKLTREIDFELYKHLSQNMTKDDEKRYCWPHKTDDNKYIVQDASLVNGEFKHIAFKELYKNIDEFNAIYYKYPWDDKYQDYGFYDVDFTSKYYHNHSHLTLAELKTKDLRHLYKSYDIDKDFINFLKDKMEYFDEYFFINQENTKQNTISITINQNEDILYRNFYGQGIDELCDIKKKYEIENDDDIRIVFAFDS